MVEVTNLWKRSVEALLCARQRNMNRSFLVVERPPKTAEKICVLRRVEKKPTLPLLPVMVSLLLTFQIEIAVRKWCLA